MTTIARQKWLYKHTYVEKILLRMPSINKRTVGLTTIGGGAHFHPKVRYAKPKPNPHTFEKPETRTPDQRIP